MERFDERGMLGIAGDNAQMKTEQARIYAEGRKKGETDTISLSSQTGTGAARPPEGYNRRGHHGIPSPDDLQARLDKLNWESNEVYELIGLMRLENAAVGVVLETMVRLRRLGYAV
jgi:hypothetical protein